MVGLGEMGCCPKSIRSIPQPPAARGGSEPRCAPQSPTTPTW